jgi:hypothetical protein
MSAVAATHQSLKVLAESVADVSSSSTIQTLPQHGINGVKLASSGEGSIYNVQTKSTTSITTFSLKQLLELSKGNRNSVPAACTPSAASAPVLPPPPVINAAEPEFEVIQQKKEIIVIDLLDSSDDEAPSATKPPVKSANTAAQQPVVRIDEVVIKKEVQAYAPPPSLLSTHQPRTLPPNAREEIAPNSSRRLDGRNSSDCEGESDGDQSYGETASTLDDSEEASLVPVKLEWPARRMDKYEMAAMRGKSCDGKFSLPYMQ